MMAMIAIDDEKEDEEDDDSWWWWWCVLVLVFLFFFFASNPSHFDIVTPTVMVQDMKLLSVLDLKMVASFLG